MCLRALLFIGALCVSVASSAAEPPTTLLESRQIWAAAPHNAFTDLIRHQGKWFCVFREGSSHVPGTNGTIRVIGSDDGAKWDSAALISEKGIDLRDPKISLASDGRLMLLMGGSVYSGDEATKARKLVTARTRVSFSAGGSTWTAPQPVSVPEGEWLWRITWHKGVGYGFSYNHGVPASQVKLTLWRTKDGVSYEKVVTPVTPATCWPDEATIRFLPDDSTLALVRGEQKDRHMYLGRSKAPYEQWQFVDGQAAAQGPCFLILPDGRMPYAGRDFPNGAKTAVGLIVGDVLKPLLVLPSGGDTSYPGMVWHDGVLWISYYSSHEGKAAIYLAKVRLP